jgi:hypothetical protein
VEQQQTGRRCLNLARLLVLLLGLLEAGQHVQMDIKQGQLQTQTIAELPRICLWFVGLVLQITQIQIQILQTTIQVVIMATTIMTTKICVLLCGIAMAGVNVKTIYKQGIVQT